MEYIWWIFGVIVGEQVFDLISTWQILDRGGSERNTVVKALMDAIGVLPALLLIKTMLLTLLAILIHYYPSDYLAIILAIVAAGYGWVYWNNFRNL